MKSVATTEVQNPEDCSNNSGFQKAFLFKCLQTKQPFREVLWNVRLRKLCIS